MWQFRPVFWIMADPDGGFVQVSKGFDSLNRQGGLRRIGIQRHGGASVNLGAQMNRVAYQEDLAVW